MKLVQFHEVKISDTFYDPVSKGWYIKRAPVSAVLLNLPLSSRFEFEKHDMVEIPDPE